MSDDIPDKESYDKVDKMMGGMFSKQFGGFEEMMGGTKRPGKKCKHSPDLTKMPVSCKKCGIRMKLGE